MPTAIYLIRHGQTDSNFKGIYMGRSNENINYTGYKQAYRLSSRLSAVSLSAIYSSPLRRAKVTADIISRPHRLGVVYLDEITEIFPGQWQGMKREEIKSRWPDLWYQSRHDPSNIRLPDGESYQEATKRALSGLNRVANEHRGGSVVMVTHDVIIRVLVAHVLGVTNSIYRHLEVDNASITRILIDNPPLLATFNDTTHLTNL